MHLQRFHTGVYEPRLFPRALDPNHHQIDAHASSRQSLRATHIFVDARPAHQQATPPIISGCLARPPSVRAEKLLSVMGSLRTIILFTLLRVYCCIAGELLVFPEGEVHSILCTAPDEDHFEISWRTAAGEVGNEGTFTVGDEEPVTNGTKGRRLMFTASPEVNGTILRCVVVNFDQPSDSPEPLEFTIIIQGLLINLWVVVLETLNRHPGGS